MGLRFAIAARSIPRVHGVRSGYSAWFLYACTSLFWSVSSLLLSGCPAPAPPFPSPPVQTRPSLPTSVGASAAQQQAFAAAEALRTQGKDIQALRAFDDFVRRYPSSVLTAKALLALGALATKRDNPIQAEGYYRRLIEGFPFSSHIAEAHLERGVLWYHLQDDNRSLTSLQQSLATSTSPQQQAKAHYYMGAIARQQQRYLEAIAALKIAAEAGADTALKARARNDLEAIIRHNLDIAALKRLAPQYPNTYPGDLMLLQLAHAYRGADNRLEEMAVWQRFIAAFHDHPSVVGARSRLQKLQAFLTTDLSKIGVLLPLTGEGSLAGQRALWGLELALAILQESGTAGAISLVIRDTQGSGSKAKQALDALVHAEHVIGVIGPLLSQVAMALVPLADEFAVPVISPYARDSRFPFLSPYAFRNSLTDAIQGRFLAEYAIYSLNLTRFAVLYPDEPYGTALKDLFIENVIQLQGEVVAVAAYPPETSDFRQHIKRIGGVDDETLRDLLAGADLEHETAARGSEKSPKIYDAIFLPGYYDKVGLIAPELAFYNITGVQLLGSDGWNASKIIEIGERFVEGGIFVDGFFVDAPSPLVATFVERFQARYGKQPGLYAAQAYDTLGMVAQVLQTGIETRQQLRHGLLQVRDYPGVSGTTTMAPDGNADKILYLLTIRDGQIVQLN